MTRYLLDTHVFLWWITAPERLSGLHAKRLSKVREGTPIFISDITLWEIALLTQQGRIRLRKPLREWLEQAAAPPLVERVHMDPVVLSALTTLPESFHRDPADRLIVASALAIGAKLLTIDERIIDAKIVDTE